MDLPFGYHPQGTQLHGLGKLVCKFHKSIYDLEQASCQWNIKFTQTIVDLRFTQSKADYSLFTQGQDDTFVTLLVYVDDIILVGPNAT